MKTVKLLISGRVQGVYFRAFIKENADRLGLKGYAKNLNDRRVEAVFQGNPAEVNEIIELCKKGPDMSHVENIEIVKIKFEDYTRFDIR